MATTIQSAEQRAQALEQKALQYQASGITMADKLKEAVSARYSTSNPIVQQRDAAAQTALTSSDRARADLSKTIAGGAILSPTQQQSILTQRNVSDIIPLASLNEILQRQYGGMDDSIDAATRAFQAESGLVTGQAGLARKQADSLYDRSIKERELAAKSSGGPESFSQRLAMFNALKPGSNQEADAVDAKSGLNSLAQMRNILFGEGSAYSEKAYSKKGSSALKNSSNPISSLLNKDARTYNNLAKNAYDLIARNRTGAVLGLSEEQFYKTFVPGFTDTPQEAARKIAALEQIYQDVYDQGQNPLHILFGGSGVGQDEFAKMDAVLGGL